ncbi:MAG: hypothetical protein ABH834_05640 [Candidatus Altiarchaeota archaeon]
MRNLASLLVIGVLVLTSGCVGPIKGGDALGDAFVEIGSVLCYLHSAIKYMVGSIALFFIVWAGLKWVGSQDNPQDRILAKKMVEGVIVGLLIVTIAVALVSVIIQNPGFKCDDSGLTLLTPTLVR